MTSDLPIDEKELDQVLTSEHQAPETVTFSNINEQKLLRKIDLRVGLSLGWLRTHHLHNAAYTLVCLSLSSELHGPREHCECKGLRRYFSV